MPTIDDLLDAIRQAESGGNDKAVSPKGAKGPFQFMPATAREFGLKGDEVFDPVKSRAAAKEKVNGLIDQYGGDTPMAIAAYNLGQGNLRKVGGDYNRVPETKNYVNKVINLLNPISTAKADETPWTEEELLKELQIQNSEPVANSTPWTEEELLKELQATGGDTGGGDTGEWQGSTGNIAPVEPALTRFTQGIGGNILKSIGNLPTPETNIFRPAIDWAAREGTKGTDRAIGPAGRMGKFIGDMTVAAPASMVTGALPMALASGAIAGLTTEGDLKDRAMTGGLASGLSMLGSGAGAAISKTLQPYTRQLTPVGERLVDNAKAMGIKLNAAQTTGNKSLAYMDSALDTISSSSTQQQVFKDAQREAWKTKLFAEGGHIYDPEINNLQKMKERGSALYEDLTSRNNLKVDPIFKKELQAVKTNLLKRLPTNQKGIVKSYLADLNNKAVIPGDVYQNTRHMLDVQANGFAGTDTATADALKAIRAAMDSAMGRGLNGADKAAWKMANKNHMVMKNIEKATDSTTHEISPNLLRNSLHKRDPNIMKYGNGPQGLKDIADVGKRFIGDKLPNSGTSQRSAWIRALTNPISITTAIGGVTGGLPGLVAGMAAGYALPKVASNLLNKSDGYLAHGLIDMTKNVGGSKVSRESAMKKLLSASLVAAGSKH